MKPSSFAPLALALICSACLTSTALAQTQNQTQKRPAAKPAAADTKTLAIGGGGSGGAQRPVLTREELRACLSNEASVRSRIAEHESKRAPLDAERQQIATVQEELKTERVKVDESVTQVEAFRAKMAAHTERVKTWNAEVAAFNERSPSGAAGERARVRLNQERDALQKLHAELETERAQLQTGNGAIVEAYNTKSKALQERIGAWNQGNSDWNEASRRLESERLAWVDECADRRYREDDELAIKAGR